MGNGKGAGGGDWSPYHWSEQEGGGQLLGGRLFGKAAFQAPVVADSPVQASSFSLSVAAHFNP